MAIDYDLQIESRTKAETVFEQIIQINGFQTGDRANDFFTAGLVGGVRPEFEQQCGGSRAFARRLVGCAHFRFRNHSIFGRHLKNREIAEAVEDCSKYRFDGENCRALFSLIEARAKRAI